MITTDNLAIRLESVLGGDRIGASEEELRNYAVDGVIPRSIVRPNGGAEVAEIVQFAVREKLSVIAGGSRSKMGLGMTPARHDIAMDMRGMREIAHYDAGDLTLSVEAGMPLTTLEKVLGEKNQFLPIAVPCYETSTVGGAVASAIDSTLRQQFGTVRDFLIGAEFVDGKGQLCKSGGRVVKNVTGYDLHKLLVGSLGTLGIITRLNFRTFPSPRVFGGFVAEFAEIEAAVNFRSAVEARGLPIANLELLDPEAASLTRGQVDRAGASGALQNGTATSWLAYVSYEGNEAVVQRVSRELETLARNGKAMQAAELDSSTDAAIGGVMREAFNWLRGSAPAVALFRITLPSLSSALLGRLREIAEGGSLRSARLVRAGGLIYFGVFAEQVHLASIDALSKVAEAVFSAVASTEGGVTLLHAPQTLKQRINAWGARRGDFALMQRVKRAFDPSNIFAPGRFVGGL